MKTIYTTLAILLAPSVGLAQATFSFFNYAPAAGIDAPILDAEGNRLFGTNYLAILYGGSTPDSLRVATDGNASMDPHPIIRIQNNQAGYFGQGGFVVVDDTIPTGRFAWLQVRVWDARIGATYEDVAALGQGGYGASALFYTYGGDLGAEGLPPQPLRGLQSFSLVPEPSTWALLVLGGGWLVWRCRRNR
jgi:hypothetical protein